jgi:hypothetical protein
MRKAFIILCLTVFSATAHADLAQNLLACARIADDARRLACYDRFATEVIEIGLSGQTQGTAAPAIGAGVTAGAAASASLHSELSASRRPSVMRISGAPK